MNRFIQQPVVTGDAVARYERYSHGGSTWYDIMMTPANGTDDGWVAPPLWPTFDGDQTVVVGQPAKLMLTGNMSFVAWASQDAGVSGYERVMNRDGVNRFIMSLNDTTGRPFVMLDIGGVQTLTGTGPTNDGAWHMMAVTYNGATFAMYIDGVLDVSAAVAGSADIDTATNLDFGSEATIDNFLEGRLDTCRIYSRALSANEILRDYHAGKLAHP